MSANTLLFGVGLLISLQIVTSVLNPSSQRVESPVYQGRNIFSGDSKSLKSSVYKESTECGEQLIALGDVYKIGFPIAGRHRCSWTFRKTSPFSKVRIHCPEINIHKVKRCKMNWLSVTDGQGLKERLCGSYQNLELETSGTFLRVTFRSTRYQTNINAFSCRLSVELLSSSPDSLAEKNICPSCGRDPLANRSLMPPQSETRIVDGVDAPQNAHPWQGGLVHMNETDVWCGAVLISDQYLLTAAHCAKSIHPEEEEVNVILGTNRVLEGEDGNQQRIPVSKVIMHIDYNPLNLVNDIALLRLKKPAILSATVYPICMPTKDEDYTGTMATVTGWGKLSEGGPHSETLQQVDVQIISPEDCIASYNKATVTEDHVCAGGNGTDACQADSGGPLVVTSADGRKILWGIISWGKGCGRIGYPGVYVKVIRYLTWISSQVKKDSCGYLTHLPDAPASADTSTSSRTCTCGVRNRGNRIVGGVVTSLHEYPWQVAIVGYYGVKPFCGASIISDRWLLTAAHCAKEMHHDDQVLIGEHNWRLADETTVTARRNIEKIIRHPDHNKRPMDSDLALLKLSQPIDFSLYNNTIAPVCLPSADNDFEKGLGIATGWGVVKFAGFQSIVLREVEVPIIDRKTCQKSYGSYVTENMICAGYGNGGKDACQGDSGGPFVVSNESSSYVLAGIISWGLKCAMPNYPGVYVKVNNFLPWIQNHIGDSNTCQNQ